MNFRTKKRRASEVNPGALTDIMFFLMIFFLIVSTLTNPNVIKLLLPQSASSKTISKQTITISINKEYKYFIDKTEIDKEDLRKTIEGRIKKMTEPTIILRVEKSVPVQYLVDVLDAGMKLNVKVVLATQKAS